MHTIHNTLTKRPTIDALKNITYARIGLSRAPYTWYPEISSNYLERAVPEWFLSVCDSDVLVRLRLTVRSLDGPMLTCPVLGVLN